MREEGREAGGADTELKTKTPHVNVGNNLSFLNYVYLEPNFNIYKKNCHIAVTILYFVSGLGSSVANTSPISML